MKYIKAKKHLCTLQFRKVPTIRVGVGQRQGENYD